MGNTRQALSLIIERLGDVPQAIDFVQMQRDPDLWELLISLTLGPPGPRRGPHGPHGGLLQPSQAGGAHSRRHGGGAAAGEAGWHHRRLPHPNSLREGCTAILRSDCILLAQRLYRSIQKALVRMYIYEAGMMGKEGSWAFYDFGSGQKSAVALADVPGPAADLGLPPAGPSGTRSDEPSLPKVWVGLPASVPSGTDPALDGGSVLLPLAGRRAARRKMMADENSSPLPSLLAPQQAAAP
eukprot:jgi/Botrbrau1/21876/Bobra.0249s0006.1